MKRLNPLKWRALMTIGNKKEAKKPICPYEAVELQQPK